MVDVPNVEAIFCSALFNNSSFILGAVHRPPNSPLSVMENVRDYLTKHAASNTKVILCGDFNLPNIDWANFLAGVVDGAHNHELRDIAFTFDLLQVLGDFIKVQSESKPILDLEFVSCSVGNNYEYEVFQGISDNKPVLVSLSAMNALSTMKKCNVSIFARANDSSILDLLELEFDKF